MCEKNDVQLRLSVKGLSQNMRILKLISGPSLRAQL